MTSLDIRDVSYAYGAGRRGRPVVEGVSLLVPSGSAVGVVGESGSGKSTLARLATGLIRPDVGSILVDGSPLHRRIGTGYRPVQMVFQDHASSLDPRRTIWDSVAEALPGRSATRRPGRVEEFLERVHFDPARARAYPGELSGGQRQRAAIARALAADPQVLVADEVTSALDVSVQGVILNLLRELRDDLGLTLLFISHDLPVVRYVCDRIAVMHDGRILEEGETDQVVSDPREKYTKTLLNSVLVPGETRLRPLMEE